MTMTELTAEDIKNILALINRAGITGEQATTVVVLQQKLAKMLAESSVPPAPTAT
jgi:hypothetical protein